MSDRAAAYKERSRKSFDKKSQNYYETSDGKYCNKRYEHVMTTLLQYPFEFILDIGCGTGTILSRVLEARENVKVSGIDLSPGMIEKAGEILGDNAELKVGDSENLPWENGSFDAVVCNASFHHYPNPKKVLREMKRVLIAGGVLVIGDPWIPNPLRWLLNLSIKFSKDGDVRIYSSEEMRELLRETGFHSVEWASYGNRYFIVAARR